MRKIASEGVGEGKASHGGTVIVADTSQLFAKKENGKPKFVKCKDHRNYDWSDRDFTVGDFGQFCIGAGPVMDGAMIIDQVTRKF